jgi:hypothetical protein
MQLNSSYDLPANVVLGPHSPALSKFLWNWFGDPRALTRGELDLGFLNDLTPEELSLARELIRRNVKLKQNHIIEGAAALRDVEAAPALRAMLDNEADISRRLTIAGALWKIQRDPVFVDCLEQARRIQPRLFQFSHLLQILWLDDERAVDFLIDLLDERDWRVQSLTLGLLNELELGRRMVIAADKLPHQRGDYRKLQYDPDFRARMTAAIQESNRQRTNGR